MPLQVSCAGRAQLQRYCNCERGPDTPGLQEYCNCDTPGSGIARDRLADVDDENEEAADDEAPEADDGPPGEVTDDATGEEEGDEEVEVAEGPPEAVTRDLFLVWRSPRIGLRNPQRMTNPVWAWLARQRELSAWSANEKFSGPSSMAVGPGWCASRFGRSETPLADGRIIEIGGEHEDYYDPDFFIYNDVIVRHPAGELEIYGYPHEAFPPTDHHSATLVGERILVIGCLGYSWLRAPGHTPVFALDTASLVMTRVATTGDAPGWLYEHAAELTADGAAIVVRGGQRVVLREGEREHVENIDEWMLELASGVWTRLTDRRWPQWELARVDGKSNQLFWIESGLFYLERPSDHGREQLAELEQRLGGPPDFALFAARYAPPVAHTRLPEQGEDDWNVTRISVDGVTIRYREESGSVHVMIEGELPAEVAAAIVEDARRKLEELERQPYVARRLAGV